MKAATVLLALLAAAGCATTATSARRRFRPADRSAIARLLEDQRQAWNRGDLAGYMEGYARTPELVFTSGGQIRRGWDETIQRYRTTYGDDTSGMGQLAFEILAVQPLGADGAVVLGRWKLSATPNAASGVFSIALERRPEGWRIVHDHTSRD
jgi:ketosteroid isomerase-like protein